MTHRLLQRQLQETGLSEAAPPKNAAEWQAFLKNVEKSYTDHDQRHDETERTLATSTREIQDSAVRLLQTAKMGSLGEMAAGLGHEINNPLTIIAGCNHLIAAMMNDKGNFDQKRLVEMTKKIEQNVDRIARIIKALKTFSKEDGSEPFRTVRAREVMEEALNFCNEKMRYYNIVLTVELMQEALTVECQPMQVSHVILNIINNAIEAMMRVPEKWLKLSAVLAGDQLQFRIEHSGPKIPQEVMEKMMRPFFTTKGPTGTGLGLAIAKTIMERHSGEITFDQLGPFTCFVISLPLTQGTRQAA